MTTSKRCTSCGRIKPLSDFHRNAHHKDGHSYDCKRCRGLGYWNQSAEEKRRRHALRVQRAARRDAPTDHRSHEKKRCVVCHRILLITVFQPDRVDPDGGNECAECAQISPWTRAALRRGRRRLLDHLSAYDDDMPIAAGLRG